MATAQLINDILQQAEALFHQGEFAAASQLLSDGIAQVPSAKLWNDWAAVQVSLGQFQDAERGFGAALQLDPCSTQAAENLGALLFARGCHAEAAPLLQQSLAGATAQTRPVIEEMLAQCAASGHQAGLAIPAAPVSDAGTLLPASPTVPGLPARTWDSALAYDDWCRSVFRQHVPAPGVRIACSWAEASEWGLRAYNALALLECESRLEASLRIRIRAAKLLGEIRDKNIQGDIVEFGIYQG